MNLQTFENLSICTRTIMVYSNINMDITEIYKHLPITDVNNISITKKKKKPCMSKIDISNGSIISLRYQNNFRGIVTDPEITYCEHIRQLLKDEKPLETKEQRDYVIKLGYKSDPDISDDDDAYTFGVSCILRISHFLNQVTCIISINGKLMNVMLFKDNFKIAGCQNLDNAISTIKILWGYIKNIKLSNGGYAWKQFPVGNCDEHPPRFVIDEVMTNVDFKFDFKIDRIKLNNLMNQEKYKNIIFSSKFEATSNSNVNVKMFPTMPLNFKYKCIEILSNNETKIINLDMNIYNKKAKKKDSYVTFLIFHSAKVIMSGKYHETMKTQFDIFKNIIQDNKNEIQEQIEHSLGSGETSIYIH